MLTVQIKTCDLVKGDDISVAPTLPATFYFRVDSQGQTVR
jgi:hypothetical protein